MSNVELKQTMVSFWQTVIDAFWTVNFGMSETEARKHNEYTAKKVYGREKTRGGKKEFEVGDIEYWNNVAKKLSGFDNHFQLYDRKVVFVDGSKEYSCWIEFAPVMLKRWKSYKVN